MPDYACHEMRDPNPPPPLLKQRELQKIALFVALSFFCLGLPRVVTNVTAFTLFLDTFGAAQLPYTYLGAAALAPLVGAGYLWLQRRVSFWALLFVAMAFDIVALCVAWIGLQTPSAHWLIALLTVWVEVEWMIAGLVFWGLAERMFTLRDAKRLFGIISAGEPAAVIVGGFAIPLLLNSSLATPDLVLVSALAMGVGIWIVLTTRAQFGADLAVEHSSEEEPSGFQVLGGFGQYQSYVNLIFLMVLLAEIAHFVIDNAFYALAEHHYAEKEALASFIAVFFAASGVINLLCNLFVSGPVLRRYGVGVAMLSLPGLVIIFGTLATLAATLLESSAGFFMLMAAIKLIDESVRNGVYTTGFLMVYQPLPAELRTRAHAASGSYVEQIAAGIAGLGLLGLNLLLGFGALELCIFALLLAIAWAWTAQHQFVRYREALGQAMAKRRLGAGALSLHNETSIALLEQQLHSHDAAQVIFALGLLQTHAPHRLTGAIHTTLHHPDAEVRRQGLRLAEKAALTTLAPAIDSLIEQENEPEVLVQALCAFAATDEDQAFDRLVGFLTHPDPLLRAGAIIGLMRHCGIDGALAAADAFQALRTENSKAGQHAIGFLLEELASRQFYRPLMYCIVSDNRLAQRAALRAARRVHAAPLRPALLRALRWRHVGHAAAVALVHAGDSILPALAALQNDPTTDSSTRTRVAWLLGRIGSPAASVQLWQQLCTHDLNARLAVAQALEFVKYVALGEQAATVWAEIQAAVAVAALLEQGASLVGQGERLELLRAACHQTRQRERNRLFLLLALVLPRDKVTHLAWHYNRGSEEERAYALEMLDTLLPTAQKKMVLGLLDTVGRRAHTPTHLRQFINQLDSTTIPCSAWIHSCALYAGMQDGILPEPNTLQRWARSPEPTLLAIAQAALKPSTERITGIMLTIEKVMLLRQVAIFSNVSHHFLADIADALVELTVQPGQTIMREGENSNCLYVIFKGDFALSRQGQPLGQLGPLEVFGELAVLDPAPSTETVTALCEGLLLSLDHEHLEDLMAESIEIAHGFIQMLCRQVRQTKGLATLPSVANRAD